MILAPVERRDSERCPISGTTGRILRRRLGGELAACYEDYFGQALPPEIVDRYFTEEIREYHSEQSDLRWFSPAPIGGPEFYQYLSRTYPWYYTPETWDKHYARDVLQTVGVRRFLEVGCGDGCFLEMARQVGLSGLGVETNERARDQARERGLEAVMPSELDGVDGEFDTLVMLQVLEHVPDPLGFVRYYVDRVRPARIVIAVPSHETLLSHVADPLAWPPHHVTMWSRRSFENLGEALGYRLDRAAYAPMNYLRFVQLFDRETRIDSPLGTLRSRKSEGGEATDQVARWIRSIEQQDARMRTQERSDIVAKLIKSVYRRVLRPLGEPLDTKRVGPAWGRSKWLWNWCLGKPWAQRDFWMLVVLERKS